MIKIAYDKYIVSTIQLIRSMSYMDVGLIFMLIFIMTTLCMYIKKALCMHGF